MSRFPLVILLAVIFNGTLWAKSVSTRSRRNALRDVRNHWPKGVVPYVMDKKYTNREKDVIKSAMLNIQSVSCIKFKERSNEKAYVHIQRGAGCESAVGYTGERTNLILSFLCISKNLILHELFHVLGFFHEQSRPDRDEFVKILKENVKKDKIYNFQKLTHHEVTTLDLPYDYRSILHYHDREMSKDRTSKTLVATNSSSGGKEVKMGYGEEGLSELDILKLNKLYRCPKRKMAI